MSNEIGDLLEEIGAAADGVNAIANKLNSAIAHAEAGLKEFGVGVKAKAFVDVTDEDRSLAGIDDHMAQYGLQYKKMDKWCILVVTKTKSGTVSATRKFVDSTRGERMVAYRALSLLLKEILRLVRLQECAKFPSPEEAWAEFRTEPVEGEPHVHDFHAEQLVVVARDPQPGSFGIGHTGIVRLIDKDFVNVELRGSTHPLDPAILTPAPYQIGDMVHIIGHDDRPDRKVVGYSGNEWYPYTLEGFSQGFGDKNLKPSEGFTRPEFKEGDRVFLTEDGSDGTARRGEVGVMEKVSGIGSLLRIGDRTVAILNHRLQHAFNAEDKVIVLDEDGEDTKDRGVVIEHEGPNVKIHVNGGELDVDPSLLRLEEEEAIVPVPPFHQYEVGDKVVSKDGTDIQYHGDDGRRTDWPGGVVGNIIGIEGDELEIEFKTVANEGVVKCKAEWVKIFTAEEDTAAIEAEHVEASKKWKAGYGAVIVNPLTELGFNKGTSVKVEEIHSDGKIKVANEEGHVEWVWPVELGQPSVTIENWDRDTGWNPTITLMDEGYVGILFDEFPPQCVMDAGLCDEDGAANNFEEKLSELMGGLEVYQEDREHFIVTGGEPEGMFELVRRVFQLQADRLGGVSILTPEEGRP